MNKHIENAIKGIEIQINYSTSRIHALNTSLKRNKEVYKGQISENKRLGNIGALKEKITKHENRLLELNESLKYFQKGEF